MCPFFLGNKPVLFQIEMAGVRAGGTVTISEAHSTTPTTPLMSRIHRYINVCNPMGPPGTFWDPSLFYNTEEFTLDHNEQHLLLLEVSSTSFLASVPFFKSTIRAGINSQPERVYRLHCQAELPR